MVASEDVALGRASFAERGAAEFAAEDDEGFIEHPTLAEVLEEGGHGTIHGGALLRETVADVLAGTGAVEVPAPVEELHVADALFDETTCEKAVVGEAGFAGFGAVGLEGGGGLAVDVHHLGHGGLHPEGEFVLRDAGGGLGMAEFAGLHFVEVTEDVQAEAARVPIEAVGIGGVEDGVALGAALHALVDGGQEAAAEGIAAAVGLDAAGDEDDEAGEILVFRAETVGHP